LERHDGLSIDATNLRISALFFTEEMALHRAFAAATAIATIDSD
jgi:hypothetical protein